MNNTEIVNHILQAEGWPAYTNHAADRGGPTKGGITLKTLRSIHPAASIDDLKKLSEAEARNIYETQYIISPGFGAIRDDLLRWQVVDAGILSGPHRATIWLQEAADADADGVLGPKTITAVNARSAHSVALRFCAARARGLMRIVSTDRQQAIWAAGWMNRCMSFLELEASRADAALKGR